MLTKDNAVDLYKSVQIDSYKSVQGQLNVDEAQGIVEAFVAGIGNKDSVGDICAPGCFNESLKRRKPRVVWGHNWNEPIGKVLEIVEVGSNDPRLPAKMKAARIGGLYARVQFNLKSERGRQAFADVSFFGEDQEWCVDTETEILTDRGWLKYDQVTKQDRAYVLDPELGWGKFEEILDVNIWPAKERQMRFIETGGHSSLTTGDHRWPIASNTNGGNIAWTTTEKLGYQDRIIRAAGRYDAPVVQKYTDAFVELVAWFWTEGWVAPASHTDAGLYIAQSTRVNPQHVASIRAAMQSEFPGQWSERHSSDEMARFRLKRESAEAIRGVTGFDKEPTPEFLTNLTRSQLLLLIQTCMSGDGHVSKNNQSTWYQVSEVGVRIFEMACALAGQPTNTTEQKDYGNRFGRPPKRVSLLRNGVSKPLDAIRVKGYKYKKGAPRTLSTDEWITTTDEIWCPTTPSGTWLARRNGTVYFTGNSIGYKTIDAEFDSSRQANVLKTLELYEVSPVLHGANQLTGTISIKVDESVYTENATVEHDQSTKSGEYEQNRRRYARSQLRAQGIKPNAKTQDRSVEENEARARAYDAFDKRAVEQNAQEQVGVDGGASKPDHDADGNQRELARALAEKFGGMVRIRESNANSVVFDHRNESATVTMRVSYSYEDGQFTIGDPHRVKPQTVYVNQDDNNSRSNNDARRRFEDRYNMDKNPQIPSGVKPKSPEKADPLGGILPQELVTGDILRGHGPRRGNLEKLLRYWRPIMKKPGGFRRCRVILANHPELYPLSNICAWLHHETTGVWPNEGCHHPGMKNCRKKLKGVVDGSIWNDSEWSARLAKLSGGKSDEAMTREDFMSLFDESQDAEVRIKMMEEIYNQLNSQTEPDAEDTDDEKFNEMAYNALRMFMDEESDFVSYMTGDDNWVMEGEDENDQTVEKPFIRESDKDCGCGGDGEGDSQAMIAALASTLMGMIKDLDQDIDIKAGRTISGRNMTKLREASRLLMEVLSAGGDMEEKEHSIVVKSDTLSTYEIKELMDPVIEHYGIETECTQEGVKVYDINLLTDDAYEAFCAVTENL